MDPADGPRRNRPRLAGALAWTFLVSSSVEVGLIAVQAWRGRASHFNVMEAGDAAVFALMGAAVGFMSLCLLGLLVWFIATHTQTFENPGMFGK